MNLVGLLGKALLAGFLTALGAPGIGAPVAPPRTAAASEAAAPPPSRILILYDEDKDDLPGLARVDRSLREAFRAGLGKDADIHSESLGLSHFDRAGYESLAADFYRHKYAGVEPDLVVAVLEPSLDFLLAHAGTLFPGVPIVFSGVDAAAIEGKTLPANVTGVLVKRTFSPTLEVALGLQPETRHVFVVGGASAFDRYLEGLARRDLEPYAARVDITYLFGLPIDACLARLASLPPNSVVLYTTMFSDTTGRTFVPHEVAASIAAKANAPVYVSLDQYVGLGVVGGNVYSFETHAAYVAELGTRILRGASPASLPVRDPPAQVNLFDGRALQRWKLDEARLPAGSIVRYREPSAWSLYRGYIVAAIALLLAEAALIAGLLLARRRQRRAEAEALRQRDALAHVLRVTTLGELTSSLAHEVSQPLSAILLNAEAAMQCLGSAGTVDAKGVREALDDILASAAHAARVVGGLRKLFRKERVEPVAVDVNALVGDVVHLLHAAMLMERVRIRLALGEGLPPVFGDPVQLEQVLVNVVRNACDAIGARGDGPRMVTIRTRQGRPGYVAIEVADTGIGVKEGELERMFEQFVSTKPDGLGMGLAISRSIIGAHGGLLWATANEDRGLTLHIELIAYVSEPRPAQASGDAAARALAPAPRASAERPRD